jgi:phosphate:Na+ symporter
MEGILLAIGGLGMFLLGMSVMTDGLRTMADDRLRQFLSRSTHSPLSGAVTGAVSTAIVQSSSATTVAAIGFVGAGLLTFPQALGILFGANIGTTITGWLVALVGFKLKLDEILLPLILVGVMLRLFGSKQWQGLGNAVAGFGLIFVGIAMLQDGMSTFSDVVTPESFPPDTFFGRILLVLIGIIITVITQSSSAGVAMALTAVSVGSISLAQAAAMVIGMDIGTTVTALVATIGGTVQARRTGWSHVIYNVMTGTGAFLLLTPYLMTLDYCAPQLATTDPEIALVGFHTLFNTVGVLAVIPFTDRFAALIRRLIPAEGNPLIRRLDQRLLETPDLALSAVEASVRDLVCKVFHQLSFVLRGSDTVDANKDQQIDEAIEMTQQYLSSILVAPKTSALFARKQASIHILDHLRRLVVRIRESARINTIRSLRELDDQANVLATTAENFAVHPAAVERHEIAQLRRDYQTLKQTEKELRQTNIAKAARGAVDTRTAVEHTDAARAIKRIGYHVWRIIRQYYADDWSGKPT